MGTNPPEHQPDKDPIQKNHLKESKMAAKGVLCFALISTLATLATAYPEGRDPLFDELAPGDADLGEGAPLCECINPFLGTSNAYRGDSDALCGENGPGFCYVPCDADCSDIQQTASLSRCQSVNACKFENGLLLLTGGK